MSDASFERGRTRFLVTCSAQTQGPHKPWIWLITGTLPPPTPVTYGWSAYDQNFKEIHGGPASSLSDGRNQAIAWAKANGYTTNLGPNNPWGCDAPRQ